MPNLYATPTEIIAASPDIIRSTTTKYNALLLSLSERVSRMIDGYCARAFYPLLATRYYSPIEERAELEIHDLISLTAAYYSTDEGLNYTQYSTAYVYGTVWGDYNSPKSWTHLELNPYSSQGTFPAMYHGNKVTGVWAYADDRNACWEDSGIDLSNSATAGATSIKIADVTVNDQWGVGQAIQVGRIIKIDSEFMEVISATNSTGSTDTPGVVRGRNGTTAAAHSSGSSIYLWRPPEPVKQACIIQATRSLERGLQAYGDARATAEVGSLVYERALDPEAKQLLWQYMRHFTP